MNVYIKSFGRPHYLDRCIRSIKQLLSGDYSIVILDDGTAPRYLDRIQQLHPGIRIERSDLYAAKCDAVEAHLAGKKAYAIRQIPVGFWRRTMGKGSSVFLLMEEDGWLTGPVNADMIHGVMQTRNLATLKLYWSGSKDMVRGPKGPLADGMEYVTPDLPVTSLLLMRPFLNNALKIRSILLRLKLLPLHHLRPYYTLYTVSSAFFSAEYWSYIWANAGDTVRETTQLLRALEWYKAQPQTRYGKTLDEKATTTYHTSSVNSLNGVPFDMLYLNHLLSEAWYHGALDCYDGFPDDLPLSSLAKQVSRQPGSPWGTFSLEAWKTWIGAFRSQFF